MLVDDRVMEELLRAPTKRRPALLLPLLTIVVVAKETTVDPLAVPSTYEQLPLAPMALIVDPIAAKVNADTLETNKKLCLDVAVSVELTHEIVTAEEVV